MLPEGERNLLPESERIEQEFLSYLENDPDHFRDFIYQDLLIRSTRISDILEITKNMAPDSNIGDFGNQLLPLVKKLGTIEYKVLQHRKKIPGYDEITAHIREVYKKWHDATLRECNEGTEDGVSLKAVLETIEKTGYFQQRVSKAISRHRIESKQSKNSGI